MSNTNDEINTAPAQQALAKVIAALNAAGSRWNSDGLAEVYTDDALFHGGGRALFSTLRDGQRRSKAGGAITDARP